MKIILAEYEDRYAASEAKMWNMSQNYWGGGSTIFTEEMIKDIAKNSGDLNSYQALKDDEVLGVCTLQEFWADRNILYIGYLNVRPDYHGKKIGKRLILKCIERTIELGKPELDLYTWAGNTKAIPLYKKCGFFWEKREDSIRLMNFIPVVLRSEALSETLKDMDWYEDSTRKIATERDGEICDGLECYEYSWKKEEKKVKMQFERFGHGLRLLETEDFLIKMDIEDQNVIYERNYPVTFEIRNKSRKKLDIDISGQNDSNILFNMEEKTQPEKDIILKGNFYVDKEIVQKNDYMKFPSVSARVKINGKEAVFAIGIKAKPPANIVAHLVNEEHQVGETDKLYVDIVSNLKEKASFSFELQDEDLISFDIKKFQVELNENEKITIAISYKLKKQGYYEKTLVLNVTSESGGKFSFSTIIGAVFNGIAGKFKGEKEGKILVFNGRAGMSFDKQKHFLIPFNGGEKQIILIPLKLGKPYSKEFTNTLPTNIEFIDRDETSVLKIKYESKDFPGITVISTSEIYQNGLIKQYYILRNNSSERTYDDIWLNEGINFNFLNSILPIKGNYITLKNGDLYPGINFLNISENWFFLANEITTGLAWDSSLRMAMGENSIAFLEHRPGKLGPDEEFISSPLYIACGLFKDWRNFRNFATGLPSKSLKSSSDFSLSINNGNPFVEEKVPIDLKSHYITDQAGKLKVKSKLESVEEKVFSIEKCEMKIGKNIVLERSEKSKTDTLTFDFVLDTLEFSKIKTVFYKSRNNIENKIYERNGIKVFEIKNDKIIFRAAPKFGNALFSLKYDSDEWLDSSFPKAAPKSWWNPWLGGISIYLSEISQLSMLEELTEADFCQKRDTRGNLWKGIKMFTELSKHGSCSGFGITQYYLTLPGVPVLCTFNKFTQNTGTFFSADMKITAFLKTGNDFRKSWFELKDLDCNIVKYLAGKCGYKVKANTKTRFGSDDRKEKLIFFANDRFVKLHAASNTDVIFSEIIQPLRVPSGGSIISDPMFMFFTHDDIDEKTLSDLENITFNMQNSHYK